MDCTNILMQGDEAKYQVRIEQEGFNMETDDFEIELLWGMLALMRWLAVSPHDAPITFPILTVLTVCVQRSMNSYCASSAQTHFHSLPVLPRCSVSTKSPTNAPNRAMSPATTNILPA